MSRFVMVAMLVVVTLSGCAAALSSFQPAHVASKGSVRVETGMDVSVPTGTIFKVVDAGKTLAGAADDRELTDAERAQVIEAGMNLALTPPAPVTHVGVTYTPLQDWEVGVRYASGGWRLGMRRQLLHQAAHTVDLTVGIAVGRFAYEFPVNDVLGVLTLDDFTRYSLEIPIVVGQHADWYRWWGGPRLVLHRFSTALTFTQPPVGGAPASATLASVDGTGAFVGAQGGIALGYRTLFVAFELTVVQLVSSARLEIVGAGQELDLSGLVIYPGIALMGEF